MNRANKIAVTVITGFLGSGKTTFINSVLKKYPDVQFALVENEFGDVSIDTKLIKGLDASQMFELKQGCICCTISDEYELVLLELAERFPNVEHLLIETTGIADPASVIRPFFRDENLHSVYQFKGTVCLVDAINYENSPEKEITIKQIVVADLILVSKSEQLSEIQRKSFKENLKIINPFAEIEFTQSTGSDFLAPFGGKGVKNMHLTNLSSILRNKSTEFNFTTFSKTHTNLSTKTLQFNQPLKKEQFLNWLSYTLDLYKTQIYRTKGILCFENEPYEFILQGVGGSFELVEGSDLSSDSKSEIVFIGNLQVIKGLLIFKHFTP
jgi:G3E family GTPase